MAQRVLEVQRPTGPAGASRTAAGAPPNQSDPRVERTRRAVLAAAADILEEQGWEAVTHVAVSERSGVGRTTLYRHWPTATALLIEVIANQAMLGKAEATGDLRYDLIAELERFRLRLHDPVCERGMVTVMERAAVDPEFADLRATITADATKTMRSALALASSRGEIDISDGLDELVAHLVGPVAFRWLFLRQAVTKRFVTQVVDSFLAAHQRGPGHS